MTEAERIPDRFIEKYFPTPKEWERCVVDTGVSPRSPGEAEAVKRFLSLNNAWACAYGNSNSLDFDVASLETWYWSDSTIRSVMAMDLRFPDTYGKIGLPPDIGQGIHLFNVPEEGVRLPSALIITGGEVFNIAVTIGTRDNGEEGTVIFWQKSPDTTEAFMLAANMLCFLKQRLVVTEKVKGLSRPDRKRIGKDSPDSKVEVNTVRWRRGVYNGRRDDRIVGTDFHFPVVGHFRWQWYSSAKEYRRIWIDGYFKGDVTKPLKTSNPVPKVNKVTI
ncbi:MAG: hypothetical protein OXF42_01855 [Candidatus Dadabacteria bacterium]|nr:hypothetical protein [Candidatus Dadabacteria bacterium]